MSTVVKLAKVLFSLIWLYSIHYDFQYQPRLGHEWYIYKLIMLTNINFVIITIYSLCSTLSTLFSLNKLKKYVDHALVTTIFPSALVCLCIFLIRIQVTCVLFWGLYAVDPELVMPAWIRQLIPSWLNHVTHTLPVIYVFFEIFSEERNGVSTKGRLFLSFLLVGFYFKVIFAVKYLEGFWLYPLLGFLHPIHFVIAFGSAVFGYYLLTQLANSLLKKRRFKKIQ